MPPPLEAFWAWPLLHSPPPPPPPAPPVPAFWLSPPLPPAPSHKRQMVERAGQAQGLGRALGVHMLGRAGPTQRSSGRPIQAARRGEEHALTTVPAGAAAAAIARDDRTAAAAVAALACREKGATGAIPRGGASAAAAALDGRRRDEIGVAAGGAHAAAGAHLDCLSGAGGHLRARRGQGRAVECRRARGGAHAAQRGGKSSARRSPAGQPSKPAQFILHVTCGTPGGGAACVLGRVASNGASPQCCFGSPGRRRRRRTQRLQK